MGLRDQITPEQLRQGRRVDGIRLHFGVADRLHMLGVPEPQVNTLRGEQVAQPVPRGGRLDDGALGVRATVECGEVAGNRLALRGELYVAHWAAVAVDCGDDDGPLVQVDARVQHGASRRETARYYGVTDSRETSWRCR